MGPAQPITQAEQLRGIEARLSPRDKALFVLGIQLGLRGTDLLSLNIRDVRYLKAGDPIRVKEGKTKKWRTLYANQSVVEVVKPLLDRADDEPLFVGEKRGTRLTICTLSRLWRTWTELGGSNVGRKTAIHLRWKAGVNMDVLSAMLNHSSTKVTRVYAAIPDEEIRKAYLTQL